MVGKEQVAREVYMQGAAEEENQPSEAKYELAKLPREFWVLLEVVDWPPLAAAN